MCTVFGSVVGKSRRKRINTDTGKEDTIFTLQVWLQGVVTRKSGSSAWEFTKFPVVEEAPKRIANVHVTEFVFEKRIDRLSFVASWDGRIKTLVARNELRATLTDFTILNF